MESNTSIENRPQSNFAFGRTNYILMGIGLLVLIMGYVMLGGGGSNSPDQFNDAMFDNRRLFLAPILIVAGFGFEIAAIMYKMKK